MSECECELLSEKQRVTCFFKTYNNFLRRRKLQPVKFEDISEIKDISLILKSENSSVISEVCDGLIWQSFFKGYIRTHPKFMRVIVLELNPYISAYDQL